MSNFTSEDYKKELERVNSKSLFRKMVKSSVYTLITVAAIAVLVAVLFLPVLRIYGTSMTPTLDEGEYVIALKTDKFETGDVVAFYFNNKVLVKRVIAKTGEWVDIDSQGNVYVNNVLIDEPYVSEKALGDCFRTRFRKTGSSSSETTDQSR